MQEEGINYWATYAPVVSWRTIHLTLILCLLSGLKSRQLDYVSAYTQAPLDCDLYMNIPTGFVVKSSSLEFTRTSTKENSSAFLLCIKKNMYGLKKAGNNWFDTLRTSLLERGFTQSSIGPCLFIRSNCIIAVNIDDCLLFAKSDAILDSVIASLQPEFNLTLEGDVGTFLGVDIKRTSECFLELIQPGLISNIISLCGLETESNQHKTPATTILNADPSDLEREQTWNYRSIIGMLAYLSTSTRPDIAFAVHQSACFCTAPKCSRNIAVRRIIRYLKRTKDCGYILHPSSIHHNIDCYVDADFAGLWSPTRASDPISVKSCTGYIITFASCPVLWSSKLQTENALSTTEAEYIAMSQATRDLTPMHELPKEFSPTTKLIVRDTITHSTIFEDNKGCVDLASAPKLCPRTKHNGPKYHHFRSHIENGSIKIQWIDSQHNLLISLLNLYQFPFLNFSVFIFLDGDLAIRGSVWYNCYSTMPHHKSLVAEWTTRHKIYSVQQTTVFCTKPSLVFQVCCLFV